MTKPQHFGWWSGIGVVVLLIVNICFTTWPTELFQLPLIVHAQPEKVDVVIVLGAGARKYGEPLPPQAKERVQRGVSLINQGFAKTMIVAGGFHRRSGYVEAELMKTYAFSLGLAADQIVIEDQSTDTWENAVYSLDIMRRHEWQKAMIVTSPYHTLRACAIFHKQGATTRCLAAPLTLIPTNTVYERLTDFRSVVREYGAIMLFVLQHYQ